ncbi:MAG TPA: SAM-dependent chlorinase/fluorinase [Thermodesulfobacteriota bacterium]|nr:SAM-dependent chlorinase/fluorinase [Thermodesulfobacteriota bacterium]
MKRIITLTTDFGVKDHYVGVMKGVILSINPDALIVDITHEIPPHDVLKGAFTLRNFYRYFPEGTIHVVVIDPGVGSQRKPVAVEAEGNIFVGPDNGVFTFVYSGSKSFKVIEISNPIYTLADVSSTFHGRDIFAPVAGYISMGAPIEDLGKEVWSPVKLPIKEPQIRGNEIIGEVVYTDHFGNLVTNIPHDLVKSGSKIYIGKDMIKGISRSYSEVPEGELLAIIGSSGFLEISVNQGRASDMIDLGDGTIIVLDDKAYVS